MKLSKNDDRGKRHRKLENLPCFESYEIKPNRCINEITIDSPDLNDLYEHVISLEIGFVIGEKYDMQIAPSRVQQYSRNTYSSNAMYTTQFRTSRKIRAGGVGKSESETNGTRPHTTLKTVHGLSRRLQPHTEKSDSGASGSPENYIIIMYYYVYVRIQ